MKGLKGKCTKGMALLLALILCVGIAVPASLMYVKAGSVVPVLNEAAGWFESAYVEWSPAESAESYKVYVKKDSENEFTTVLDDQLIRKYKSADGSYYYRADALGLAAGSYQLQVVPVSDGKENKSSAVTTSALEVVAYDRSGFAWVNGESNGAYNADGTLKSGAVILYVTNETKDTISMEVVTDAKGTKKSAAGLQNILNLYKKGYDNRPLNIRLIGQVTDFATMEGGDISISGSGDTKRLSCGITLEGVGEDATAYGWGIKIKNCSNVEVRNIGTMVCDSSEGDNISLQQSNDHVWVHNCDFFYGEAGGDADQAKGDGSLDCKKSTYITFSYNHFFDNGKCNLLGLKEGTTDGYYITYHHNWYDHSDSRHPRVRYYTAHVYNNYYDGNSKYGIGSTMGSSIYAESNYFENCKYPMMISMQGTDISEGDPTFSKEDGGIIKAYNNYMVGHKAFVSYAQNSTEFDAYVVDSADTKVPSTVVSKKGGNTYNNFDTAATMYDYKLDTPEAARINVKNYAGRMNGGDFKWTFTDADNESYAVNAELKAALRSYTTSLVSVGGSGSGSVETPTQSEQATTAPSQSEQATTAPSGSGETSSSQIATSAPVTSGGYVHNFTENEKNSSFYSITGSISTSKGEVTYAGLTLTKALKMESSTSITFTAPADGKLTLVFGGSTAATGKKVKLNGTKYEIDATQIITLDVKAGANEVTKGDSINMFYMVYVPSETATEAPTQAATEAPTQAVTEAPTQKPTEAPTQAATEAPTQSANQGAEINKEDVIGKLELTDEEKQQGVDVKVVVDNITSKVNEVAVNLIKDKVSKTEGLKDKAVVGMYLDIELIKSVGGTESTVTNTTGKISVSIKLSDDLINTDSAKKRTYKVARIHGDVVDMLDAAFDEATGKLTFETDKFSTYAVVYVDELSGSVDTGDNSPIALFIGIAVVSVLVLVALAIFGLKDKSRK